jgi:hypothetical protein
MGSDAHAAVYYQGGAGHEGALGAGQEEDGGGYLVGGGVASEENVLVGAVQARDRAWDLARIYDVFPLIARALASGPRLLLLDEISLGLAPAIVDAAAAAAARVRRRRRAAAVGARPGPAPR